MSTNLGYQFYRCTYREERKGSNRLAELEVPNAPDRVTRIVTSLDGLEDLVKPYRPEYIPETAAEQKQEADETDIAAMLAKINARNSLSSKNDRKNDKRGKPQPKVENVPDVKKLRRDAEATAKSVNNILSFDLEVLYPGLYVGLGYAHGLPKQSDRDKEDIKTGFSFDYTTGLPYIPGSSVKGALRSRFMNQPEDAAAALDIPVEALRKVENILFGNRVKDEEAHPGCLICHDVFPVLTEQGQTLMATDNITPHKDPLAPPNPVNTLRLKPGTKLRFCFVVPDIIAEETADCRQIARKDIRKAFTQLLVDWGVGAKTNVGYGNLAEVKR